MRVKRGFKARRRRKKIMKRAEGFRSAGSRVFTVAIERSDRALAYQYRDRRQFKNDIRKIWIHRISTAAKKCGLNYSHFMGILKKKNVQLNRPALAHLALKHPAAFETLAKKI